METKLNPMSDSSVFLSTGYPPRDDDSIFFIVLPSLYREKFGNEMERVSFIWLSKINMIIKISSLNN